MRKKASKQADEPRALSIEEICKEAGIAKRTYHYWKSLPEFPKDGSPEDRLAFCAAKASGRMSTGIDDDNRSSTDWRIEKEKWQALKNKQAVEQERLKIVLAAREEILSGITEVLEEMRRKVGRAIRHDPEAAKALNALYEETISELGRM